ncbi:MAG: ROK family protein, partial [Verrucomicrobiota bacterium]
WSKRRRRATSLFVRLSKKQPPIWESGVANVATILHPELIVLGGGVARMGEILFETVRKVVDERIGMFPPETVKIAASQLGDGAGTWGGLALAANPEICEF